MPPIVHQVPDSNGIVKSWSQGVEFDQNTIKQLDNLARLPFIHKWVAAMPDCHFGRGSTVGSVIATIGAVIPAAVSVDIGCGMRAVRTHLTAEALADFDLSHLRREIERRIPHGRTANGGEGDRGAWEDLQAPAVAAWLSLEPGYKKIVEGHPKVETRKNPVHHLGTLGTGNHFVEVCLDEKNRVWIMLHSGSRGVGNRIGSYFTELAKEDMRKWFINLPDEDLAYLPEGTDHFKSYMFAVGWAQDYANVNRELMMDAAIGAFGACGFQMEYQPLDESLVSIHHNYVAREHHYGQNVFLTRKGAVCAREGMMGIIPGSMGTKSYIVRGKGNPESFNSCSHGAGRKMSRTEAKKRFTVKDLEEQTAGVECRKDEAVVDEIPGAYKSLDAVMYAQRDLVEVVHELRAILCVKG